MIGLQKNHITYNQYLCGLGKLLNAQMGVFQITAKHSTERYTWGGTHNKTSQDKTAHVTMKLTYDVQ